MKRKLLLTLSLMVALVMLTGIVGSALVTSPLKSLKLDKNTLNIGIKDSYTFKVTFSPANASGVSLKWSSDNNKTVTVDKKGKITALAKGTANITVKTSDGKLSAKCKVTVSEKALQAFPLNPPIKLKVLNIERSGWNPQCKIVKELEKRTGIILDTTWVAAGDFATKQPVLLASGSLPDMTVITNAAGKTAQEISWELGQQKLVINFNDYIDSMPYVKKASLQIGNFKLAVEDSKGNIYGLPQATTTMGEYAGRLIYQALIINDEEFGKNKIKEPKTTDDLVAVCKQLKKIYPKSYPLMSRGAGEILSVMGMFFGTDGGGGVYWNSDSGVYECAAVGNNYRNMMQYMNTLYKQKLLDPEFATTSGDQLNDKLANKKGFIFYGWIPETFVIGDKLVTQNPDFSLKCIDPLTYNGKQGKYYVYGGGINPSWLTVISAKSRYVREALAYLNYELSPECIDLVSWGIKGETYQVKDGKKQFMPNVKTKMNPKGTVDIGDYFSTTNVALGFQPSYEFFSSLEMGWDRKSTDVMYYMIKNIDRFGLKQPNFSLAFSPSETEKINSIRTPLDTYISETTIKFITGDIPLNDSEWKKFTDKVKEMKAEELVKIYNDNMKKTKKW